MFLERELVALHLAILITLDTQSLTLKIKNKQTNFSWLGLLELRITSEAGEKVQGLQALQGEHRCIGRKKLVLGKR